jgi:hypothetical protein
MLHTYNLLNVIFNTKNSNEIVVVKKLENDTTPSSCLATTFDEKNVGSL